MSGHDPMAFLGPTKRPRHIDAADVAKLIRADLKASWPYITFSVKTKRYSGGCSITVSWTDGPRAGEVEDVIGHYHGAEFDGMQDLKTYHESENRGEPVSYGNDFLFTNRHISPALWYATGMDVCVKYGVKLTPEQEEQLATERTPHIVMQSNGGYQYLQDYIWRELAGKL
jgi:hypothetical protein